MIEATCTTCGNINRVQESDLPAGARFLTCTSCKSRVGLPAPAASTAPVTGPLPVTSPLPPRVPPSAVARGPAGPATSRPATPRSGLGGPARTSSTFDVELAPGDPLFSGVDLPAPKGALPPRSAAQPSKTDITDLPAPKVRRTAPLPDLSGPPDRQITDLPAPKAKPSRYPALGKGAQSGPVERPPPRPLLDLPAPRTRGIGDLPPSSIGGIGDLPAPKRITPPNLGPITASDLAELTGSLERPNPDDLTPSRTSTADVPTIPRPRPGPGDRAAAGAAGAAGALAPKHSAPDKAAPDKSGPKQGGHTQPLSLPKPGGVMDLPAPKRSSTPDLPAPKLGGLPDLPVPKRGLPDLPVPKRGLPDLPAPKHVGVPAIPAPKQAGVPDIPTPKHVGVPDLPAPKHVGVPDIPAPKQAGVPDLPTPKPVGIPDVPTPKPPAAPDLPAPKSAAPDLPAPKPPAAPDLPAPKSATAPDLPAPARQKSAPDLTTPESFFDDLPQPAVTAKAEPSTTPGLFDDLPSPASITKPQPIATPAAQTAQAPQPRPQPGEGASEPAEAPAPKGFFDDLPGRPAAAKPEPAEAPAPKGFFDDLPGRPAAAKPEPAEAPAPKGFFDDLPEPPNRGADDLDASDDAFDALLQPSRGAPGSQVPAAVDRLSLDLEPDASRSLELEAPSNDGFGDLDFGGLSVEPEPPGGGPARSSAPAIPARSSAPASAPSAAPAAQRVALSAAAPSTSAPPASAPPASAPPAKLRPAPGAPDELREAAPSPDPEPAPAPAQPAPPDPAAAVRRTRRLRVAAFATFAALGLGAGGLVVYRRLAAEHAQRDAIAAHVTAARSAFGAQDPKRWEHAAAEAQAALELAPGDAAALGLAAEALLADSLTGGAGAAAKAARAQSLLATARAEGRAGPELDRAQALALTAGKQPDPTRLEQLAAAAPHDAALALYLGWAHAARGDAAAADRAFTTALAAEPLKRLALEGRGRARLALGELDGARADFTALLALDKDHLGAQVGLAAARPPAQAKQQEAELLAILARQDLAAADPRAAVQAWVLAAEAARQGGRLEPARERYRKAHALAPEDAAVAAGRAELELADGKLDEAAALAGKALALAPDHARAQLVAADAALRQKRLEDAAAALQALRAHKPPLPPLDQARIALLSGRLLEAQGQDQPAADAYVEAAQLAGDLDPAPALAAATKLGALAEAAEQAKAPDRAAVLRARADQVIARFAERAKQDPQLALALGQAFLAAGDGGRAEPWLRRVAEARPDDTDVRFQHARALALLGRTDDAVAELSRAGKLDERRPDVGLAVARIYEAGRKDAAAAEIYAKLLAAKDPSLEVRASAGRFYARRGELAKAAEQGERIRAADPAHPAGLYLAGERALADGKPDEAARLFRAAAAADRDPQYLEAQGRAAEALARRTGDAKQQEAALQAYLAAAAAAPTLLGPLLGQGRIYVERRDATRAIPALLAASKLDAEHPEVALLIGRAYQDVGERRVAAEWLARAYRLAPSAEAAWHLGQVYGELDATRDALAALANATRLGLEEEKRTGAPLPWLIDALYRLGRVQLDAGNERAARSAWEKYVARKPKPGPQLDEVRRELATTLQRY